MDPSERMALSPQLSSERGGGQSDGQTPRNQHSHDSLQHGINENALELQQPEGTSLHLEFQDSNLSPALSLLPVNSGLEHNFTEYSLFQQSENEFAPLRAYPDVSMASEIFHFPLHDRTTRLSEHNSLSQHPLAQATILSEKGTNCGSMPQHDLSSRDEDKEDKNCHSHVIPTSSREKVPESLDSLAGQAAEDDMFFLSKDVPVKQLLDRLQKDVGMLSSSSAVSSDSELSVRSITNLTEGPKSKILSKPSTDESMFRREGPPGEASIPQQQNQTLSSIACNISVGSRSTQPDDSTELLHRELLSETGRCSAFGAESKNQEQKITTLPCQSVTPTPTEMPESNLDVLRPNPGSVPWTGPFSAGVIRIHREQDLWSSGNQTGIDGSYLGFLPGSQSTPGVLKGPPKSSVKAKLAQLSVVESSKEISYKSNTHTPSPSVSMPEASHPGAATHYQVEATTAKVQALPSLNYMQKVDAWRANQSSGKTSLFDSLALHGFNSTSPKKKAYDAVSDSLNRIHIQPVRSQQPPISSVANNNVTQSSSSAPSGLSSATRGEAVGRAPSDTENAKSGTRPSSSPFGRSQSHSSLSTVVMLGQKDQQPERSAEKEKSDDNVQQSCATVQPSAMSLGHFSDVSVDRDVALSSSQDTCNSRIKLGTSIGASSVTSLEVDNYAPYWSSKLSTPPPPVPNRGELNIEERIPLYLQNLGIDQSPSAILTPFVPRGPIREPEFSPTDFVTIKGSVGTLSKSTQPSEGGSPHKGEYSRSSILSVDSSVSIPFSLDSLGPALSLPEQLKGTYSFSDKEAQSQRRLAFSFQPDEESQPSQEQQDSSLTISQPTDQLRERSDCNMSLNTTNMYVKENSVSTVHTTCNIDQSAEDSFVSSKALWEIRKLLSQAENVVSCATSAASSTSAALPRLLSDSDVFLSMKKKTTSLQNSLFSSSCSATEDPRTHSSHLGVRSSSDSMLTSERLRQSSAGIESITSLWQPGEPSTEVITATGANKDLQDCTAGPSLFLSKSARRAEPEGCSAAPPDNRIPTQLPVKPLQSKSTQQTSTSLDCAVSEEKVETRPGGSQQSSTSSLILEDTDQGVVSDGSSESSLAVRVAKLLHSESPATMVSSTNSITDQEESKAREWLRLKISGQHCESLELDREDRERIEEIKRELLLRKPMESQGSTDTESSAASNVKVPMRQDQRQQAETFATHGDVNNQLPQSLSADHLDSSVHPQNPLRPDLEAQVREIAAREGVTLLRTNPQSFTSITIATRRRSTSASFSTSPSTPLSPVLEPLNLSQLSKETVDHPKDNGQLPLTLDRDKKTREPALVLEPSHEPQNKYNRNQNLDSYLLAGYQRQNTVGGQFEGRPSRGLVRESFISDVLRTEQSTDSATSESPARTDHISHVRLTLSPKAVDHSVMVTVPSSAAANGTALQQKEFVPLRHASSEPSSPDEGVGLSSPPEWFDSREPKGQGGLERTCTPNLFKTNIPQDSIVSTSMQTFKQQYTPEGSSRNLTTKSPVPALLPYKPQGSEELFYIPQTEADVTSTAPSDTTMESSHTGSDDAVPPRFSSEVLGHQDPGLDRGVNIRHTEGIYSKRLKTATFKMQQPEHTDKSSQREARKTQAQASVAFTQAPLASSREVTKRDEGTSPVQFLSYYQPEPSIKKLQPVRVEVELESGSHQTQCSVLEAGWEPDQQRSDHNVSQPSSQQTSSNLEQLWQRFCERWSLEETGSTTAREASLLERLERLSRLIHSTRAANVWGQQQEAYYDSYVMKQSIGKKEGNATRKKRSHAVREAERYQDTRETERNVRERRQAGDQVKETLQHVGEDSHASHASSLSHSSFQRQHLFPADKDETETLSTISGSASTIDTARLIRVFGADRVQQLKTSSSLSKLYSTINKQKDGREQRRGRNRDSPYIPTLSETTSTEESVAADCASLTSIYSTPSHHGPSRSLTAKKTVRLVSKGIQAGDLEIVSNGTRRHTRDVGTTFPSPHETRSQRTVSNSSFSIERGRGGERSPSKSQSLQQQRKSPSKHYPEGVSWFISTDNLRSEAKKENQPEEPSMAKPSTTWFEPYSRKQAWREPLRQRQIQEDRNQLSSFTRDVDLHPEPRTKMVSSGLARVTLQEALEMRRPEFISRSRHRVRRLALQVEERRLQSVFLRERNEYLNQPAGLRMLPKPAGTALLRRAVPRKEMIQRSKQIYENLPEVQRRKEEERRKAEYKSYRLNAQLYNKKITNHVLGRRSVWQ